MLKVIREFFEKHMGAPAARTGEYHAIQAATAALLLEMVRRDGEIVQAEREAVLRSVWTKFDLSAEEAATLVRLAEEEAQEGTDCYEFTALINQHFSTEQKEQLLEYLWKVAHADADLHDCEVRLARKIADLLGVPESGYSAGAR